MAAKLKEGDKAPDFAVADQSGNVVRLKDLRGKKIVLYFYPKDDTPGCTREACSFRDSFAKFKKSGIEVFGVSLDSEKSHQKFIDKFSLPFNLLADTDRKLSESFGTYGEKKFMGRKYMGNHRMTFLVGRKFPRTRWSTPIGSGGASNWLRNSSRSSSLSSFQGRRLPPQRGH